MFDVHDAPRFFAEKKRKTASILTGCAFSTFRELSNLTEAKKIARRDNLNKCLSPEKIKPCEFYTMLLGGCSEKPFRGQEL
jgi:hypothetical protein